jgi:hypothetical protein
MSGRNTVEMRPEGTCWWTSPGTSPNTPLTPRVGASTDSAGTLQLEAPSPDAAITPLPTAKGHVDVLFPTAEAQAA